MQHLAVNMNKRQATLFQSWGKESYKNITPVTSCTSNKTKEENDTLYDSEELLGQTMEMCSTDYQDYEKNNNTCLQVLTKTTLQPSCNPLHSTISTETGFDLEAGKSWIYPTNYPLREYQFSIVKEALYKNTLVVLPTGLGKTFIAAVLLYNFYRWYPQGKVVFMAPTKPLVAQQIEACFKVMGIPQEDTVEMTGTLFPHQRTITWYEKRVFFLTPQVMANDLSRAICPATDVKCLVVDEAHKALGNHAYCQVVRELQNHTTQFRILALSATPGNDLVAVNQVLQNLLISHVELRTEESLDIQPYIHTRNIEKVVVSLGDELTLLKEKFTSIIEVYLNRLKQKGAISFYSASNLSKFQILKLRESFNQNPPDGIPTNIYGMIQADYSLCISLYHAYELLLHHGKKTFYNFLRGILDGEKSFPYARIELLRNPQFEEIIETFKDNGEYKSLGTNTNECQVSLTSFKDHDDSFNYSHPKLKKLQEIVLNHFEKCQQEAGEEKNINTRIMIFSQYRDSVQEIKDVLSKNYPVVRVMTFVGQTSHRGGKGFSQKQQIKVVRKFREGGYNTLVSTCVGEEGLDIGEVDLIICYDALKSPVRLVQRMGRTGRFRQGRIVVLLTEGKEEKMYVQSQYKKLSIFRAITKGKTFRNLYMHNPRMVPEGINPVCVKMYICVKKYHPAKTGGVIPNSYMYGEKCSRGRDGALLSDEELLYWNTHFKVTSEECIPDFNVCTSLISDPFKLKHSDIENGIESKQFLSAWMPWQNSLQETYFVGHSCKTVLLVKVMEAVLQCSKQMDLFETTLHLQLKDVFPDDKDLVLRKKQVSGKKKNKNNVEKNSNYSLEKYCKPIKESLEPNDHKHVSSSIQFKNICNEIGLIPAEGKIIDRKNATDVEVVNISSDDEDFQVGGHNSKIDCHQKSQNTEVSLHLEDNAAEGIVEGSLLGNLEANHEIKTPDPTTLSLLFSKIPDLADADLNNNSVQIRIAPSFEADIHYFDKDILSPINILDIVEMNIIVPLLRNDFERAPIKENDAFFETFLYEKPKLITQNSVISDVRKIEGMNGKFSDFSDCIRDKYGSCVPTSTPKAKFQKSSESLLDYSENISHRDRHLKDYKETFQPPCVRLHESCQPKDVSQYTTTQLTAMLDESGVKYGASPKRQDIKKTKSFLKENHQSIFLETKLGRNKTVEKMDIENIDEFIHFDLMFDIESQAFSLPSPKFRTDSSPKQKLKPTCLCDMAQNYNHVLCDPKNNVNTSLTKKNNCELIGNNIVSESGFNSALFLSESKSFTKLCSLSDESSKGNCALHDSHLPRSSTKTTAFAAQTKQNKVSSKAHQSKEVKYKKLVHDFIDQEALSGDDTHSNVICSMEKFNETDDYESSFIDDDVISDEDCSTDINALYLQSVQACAGLPQKFKLHYNYDRCNDVFSQPCKPDISDYAEDSFCVRSEIEYMTDDIISKVESSTLKQKCKRKRKRIIPLMQSSSDSEENDQYPRDMCINNKTLVKRMKVNNVTEEQSFNFNENESGLSKTNRSYLPNKTELFSIEHKSNVVPSYAKNSLYNLSAKDSCGLPVAYGENREDQNLANVCSTKPFYSILQSNPLGNTCSNDAQNDFSPKKIEMPINSAASTLQGPSCLLHQSYTENQSEHLDSHSGKKQEVTMKNKQQFMFVDPREIAGGKEIISLLRRSYNIQPVIMQLVAADFIVSSRMAVRRVQTAEISSVHYRTKLIDKLCSLCEFYSRPCVIIEKQKHTSSTNAMKRSKHMDMVISFLVKTHIKVLHSESQEETSALLVELAKFEQKKGFTIDIPNHLSSKTEQVLHFYLSMPYVSTVCSLNFACGFINIYSFMNKSIDEIQKIGFLSRSKAKIIDDYLRTKCQL